MLLLKTAVSTVYAKRGLAWQPRFWHAVFYYIFNIHGHIKLAHLFNKPHMAALVDKFPKTRHKYLFAYISPRFGTPRKYRLLYNHYRLVDQFFSHVFLDRVCEKTESLWCRTVDTETYDIKLTFPDHCEEGDLSLEFHGDGQMLYRLIFLFAKEPVSKQSEEETVIVVSAIQGIRNHEKIKRATEQLADCQPAFLLMTAIEGLALSLGIQTVWGLGTSHQITTHEGIHFSYEKFFSIFGAPVGDSDTFEIKIPLLSKNILDIPSRHRKRTQVKRMFKEAVREEVMRNLVRHLRHPSIQGVHEPSQDNHERRYSH